MTKKTTPVKKEEPEDEFDLEEITDLKTPTSDLFKKILWYAGSIIVVLFSLFGAIQFFVNKGIERSVNNQKLELIVATQREQKVQNDSIFKNIKEIKIMVKETNENVEGLSDSYILFMESQKSNKTLSSDEFLNYMEGITWESKKN